MTPNCKVRSQWNLNQTCSPRRDLSNDVLHSQFGRREEVDSRLLVVGSQIASLTPGPSFAHNMGYKCPNGQCEDIFDIYASKPFQWHQEHLNARCLGPCCWTLNFRESRRTPNPHFFPSVGIHPHTWPKWGCDIIGWSLLINLTKKMNFILFLGVEGLEPSRSTIKPTNFLFTTIYIIVGMNM